jgi:hypothetical protein
MEFFYAFVPAVFRQHTMFFFGLASNFAWRAAKKTTKNVFNSKNISYIKFCTYQLVCIIKLSESLFHEVQNARMPCTVNVQHSTHCKKGQ